MNDHDHIHATPAHRELGQSIPVIVLVFIILCGFVGLTIDVGYGLLQKRKLQAAVDLGLISGARELPSATAADGEARSYVRANFRANTEEAIQISSSTSCLNPGCSKHDKLTLRATTDTPTFFVRLFGIDKWTVGAQGAACGPCDSSPVNFDVVVVLDRSGSMSGTDMDNAREGIRELLSFFDPARDRIGLTVLESADTAAPYFGTGSSAPCESDGSSFSSTSYLANAYTSYGGSAGAFMDGTAANHDSWLVVPLAQGRNFKLANGNLNESSMYLDTLDCIKDGGSTPIGPAMDAARQELVSNGRSDALRVIIYFGDGGASATPVQRQCRSRSSSSSSWGSWRACTTSDAAGGSNREWRINSAAGWYTWTSGNRDRPCQDAIDQSARARNAGIDVYAIGYGVGTDWCRPGVTNSPPEVPNIRAADAIRRMASDPDKYFQQTVRGDVSSIFAEVGRDITAGGTRLVE